MQADATHKQAVPAFRQILKAGTLSVVFFYSGLLGCSWNTEGPAPKPLTQQQIFDSIAAQLDRYEYMQAASPAKKAWMASAAGSEFQWKFQFQYVEALLCNHVLQEPAQLLKDGPPSALARLLPRYHYLQSYLLFFTSDPAVAERSARAAIQEAQVIKDSATQIDSLLLLANFLKAPARAKAAGKQAYELATARGLAVKQAAALLDLGDIEQSAEHYDVAIGYFKHAAQLSQNVTSRFLYLLALSNTSECYFRLGDFDRAFRLLNEVRPQLKESDPDYLQWTPNFDLGYLYLLRSELPESISAFRMALQQAKGITNHHVAAAINLAEALMRNGSVDEAEKYNWEAEDVLRKVPDPDAASSCSINLNRAAIAKARGSLVESAGLYRKVIGAKACPANFMQWDALANLASLQIQQGDGAGAKQSFEQTLQLVEENRADQKQVQYQIMYLSTLIRFYQQYVDLLMSQNDANTALAVADSSHSLLTQGRAGSREVPHFAQRLQGVARSSKSVILFYWLADTKSYVWAITAGGIRAFPLGEAKGLENDVRAYSHAIEGRLQDTLLSSDPTGKRLYHELLDPVANEIPPDSRVIVVADGLLHSLNFETLLVEAPKLHYWIDDVTLTVAPSLAVLLQAGSLAPSPGKQALLFGDPIYKGTDYPPLPQSAAEIQSVSKHFAGSAELITQGAAQVSAFASAHPERFATIHFSAHVDADAQSPLDSAIILSPSDSGNRLYARDIANSKLTANLVTISGCRSAGAKTLSGEGLVGFAWASFLAGAHNAVTSLWAVDDHSTADLMDAFYAGIEKGEPYAVALRKAKRALLKSPQSRKPYYWGPFQLYSRTLPAA